MATIFRRLGARIRGAHNGANGQTLVLMAAGFAGFCGLVGMSVDVGLLFYTKAKVQNMVDAAALAGAQDLPNTTTAATTATTYLGKNGSSICTTSCISFSDSSSKISVTATKHVSYMFLQVIGLSGKDVSATASARVNHYVGGTGLLPWGLIASNNNNSTLLQNACYLGTTSGVPSFQQGVDCILKYGAGTNSGGDFGAVVLDATGASSYRTVIGNGSTTTYVVGNKIDPQTGNMVGPTQQGIADRFLRTAPAGCAGNSMSNVLTTNGDGSVKIKAGCESSPRIIIIPVVDQINNPQQSTILGFAFMYLSASDTSGGHAQVTGRFVKFVTAIPGGVYTSGDGNSTALSLVN